MSNKERKNRKRLGVPFSREPKEGTPFLERAENRSRSVILPNGKIAHKVTNKTQRELRAREGN